MKFTISKKAFAAALTSAKSMADTSSKALPILGSAVIRGRGDGKVSVLSTDLTVSLSEMIEGDVTSPGSVAVSVKKLGEIVGVLPDGDIEVRALDNHWAQIRAGRSEFKLMGMPETDFPALPVVHEKATTFTIEPDVLLDLLDKVTYAVSKDGGRPNLNGALLESDGSTVGITATDGHRLTRYVRSLAWPVIPKGIVIPLPGIEAIVPMLKRASGEVTIAIDPDHLGQQRNLYVFTPSFTFSTRLWNVAFPPYKQVIPAMHKREVRVAKADLEAALRRAVVMAPETTAAIRLTFLSDAIEMESDNPDLGATHQEVAATVTGEPTTAGFNARYLLEAASKFDDEMLTIRGQNELDPIVLVNEQQTSVVMPMRL